VLLGFHEWFIRRVISDRSTRLELAREFLYVPSIKNARSAQRSHRRQKAFAFPRANSRRRHAKDPRRFSREDGIDGRSARHDGRENGPMDHALSRRKICEL